MISTRINFSVDGVSTFDFSKPLLDFDTTVQNALVCSATHAGSDKIFPDRGTTLFQEGVQGRLTNVASAGHAANFAAMAVLIFMQQNDNPSNPFRLGNFQLQSVLMQVQLLRLSVRATSVSGEVRGDLVTL